MAIFDRLARRAARPATAGALLAALSLCAGSAPAASIFGLEGPVPAAEPSADTAAREVLPPTVGQRRAVRQTKIATTCASGFCRWAFMKVPSNRILEIDNVSCASLVDDANTFKLFLLTNRDDVRSNPVAVIPASQLIPRTGAALMVANVAGPYFFKAGETVFIFGGGDTPGPYCTISGYLAPTR